MTRAFGDAKIKVCEDCREGVTVREVIAFLSNFPMGDKVILDGPDVGGYDVTRGNRIGFATCDGLPYLYHEDGPL